MSEKLRKRTQSGFWPLTGYALLAMAATASRTLFSPEPKPLPSHGRLDTSQTDQPARLPAKPEPIGSLTGPKVWWSLIRDTGSAWMAHKAAKLGAALVYYSIFSLGPLLVIAIVVAGLVFGQEAVRGEVSTQLAGLLGDQGAKGVETMLGGAGKPRQGIFATALGAVTLLFAAIGVVVQLKDALNTIWGACCERHRHECGGNWNRHQCCHCLAVCLWAKARLEHSWRLSAYGRRCSSIGRCCYRWICDLSDELDLARSLNKSDNCFIALGSMWRWIALRDDGAGGVSAGNPTAGRSLIRNSPGKSPVSVASTMGILEFLFLALLGRSASTALFRIFNSIAWLGIARKIEVDDHIQVPVHGGAKDSAAPIFEYYAR
jgi:hypothetical protein